MGSTLEIEASAALDERDYGELTGLDKDAARIRWGAAQVQAWRRSYDRAPPGGESLRDTIARTVPFYCREILPAVLNEQAVLVSAHGNSLRTLVMVLDGLTSADISNVEIATGAALVYRLNADSTVVSKEVLKS